MGEGVGASKGRASRIHDSTVLPARFVSFRFLSLIYSFSWLRQVEGLVVRGKGYV
jgi:hypothetical protein